jgi:hypothetical protein
MKIRRKRSKKNFVVIDGVVGTATGYGLETEKSRCSSPGRVRNLHFSISSRPTLGPTQPPIQWVLGALSPG